MTPERIVPVPELIQTRAWECCYVLAGAFADQMTPIDARFAREAAARPDWGFTWQEARAAFRLYGQYVAVRT